MNLVPFLQSLGSHWLALMGSGLFTILGIVLIWLKKGANWILWTNFALGAGMLVAAAFLAWQDQYLLAQASLASPKFSLTLQDIGTRWDASTDPVTLQLFLVLLNSSGSPLEYRVDRISVTLDGRSAMDPRFLNSEALIPARTTTRFFYPLFDARPWQDTKRIEGDVGFTIEYGDPRVGLTRKLTEQCHAFIRLADMESDCLNTYYTDETNN